MSTTMMTQGGFKANPDVEAPKIICNLEISSDSIEEGEPVRLELQVTHTTDVQIDWYKDGQLLAAGSRYDSALERGFAHLDILYTLESDTGEYSCVVRNNGGEVQSNRVTLQVIPEQQQINQDVYVDKFAEMDLVEPTRRSELESRYNPTQAPAFARPITVSESEILEGEGVRFEGQLAQAFDSTVSVEWFKDGKALASGSRFNMVSDRDLILLEIAYSFKDDSGSYVCKVKNAVGEIESQPVQLTCIPEDKVVTRSILDEQSIQQLKAFDDPEDGQRKNDYEAEQEPESKPHFDFPPTTLMVAQGGSAKFLVRVSGNPTPDIEWTLNGEEIKTDSTVNIYKDGAINYLEINRCTFEQGGYRLKIVATNKMGTAEAETILSVSASEDFRPDLKHVKMANPFKKMIGLKKVEIDQELNKAFSRAKPSAESIIKMERGSEIKTKTFKSPEVLEAENILDKVAVNLRKSEANKYLVKPEAI